MRPERRLYHHGHARKQSGTVRLLQQTACFSNLPAQLSFQGESNELVSVGTGFSLVFQQREDRCDNGNPSSETGEAFKDF